MAKLSPKTLLFIKEYPVDLNGTQAAIRAGYSPKTANEQASRLLANVNIQKLIQESLDKRVQKVDISVDYVLTTIKNTIERCAQAEPVYDRHGVATGEYQFDSGAVLKGSELLGKYLKLFTDKVDISNPDGTLKPAAPVYHVVKK